VRQPAAILATLFLLLTAACDADPAASPTPPASESFPVTIGTGDTAVEIPARPERIVSLSPTATEVLFAIGAGDQVVAVDAFSDFPAGAPVTDLDGSSPNLEAIGGYEPDLVVAWIDPNAVVPGLARIGVPALLHPAATSLDDTYTQIEQLGAATGHVAEAAEVVTRMRGDLDAIAAQVPDRPEPLSYYHELDPTLYSVTGDTFLGQLYGLLGLRSIADQAGAGSDYPQLSAEFIVDADPDVILLADAQCCGVDVAELAGRPGWDELTAVRENRVVPLDDDLASRWGPRVVDLLRDLATALAALEPVD
jgi:iron complex transport system substrate-binding protein